jgi:hypothetical protein
VITNINLSTIGRSIGTGRRIGQTKICSQRQAYINTRAIRRLTRIAL